MPKTGKSAGIQVWPIIVFALVGAVAWLALSVFIEAGIAKPVQFNLKQGSGLRSAARQLQAAGILESAWRFELLARVMGAESRLQAGNYEIAGGISPFALLQKITSGEYRQDKLTIVEGWTFAQLRAARLSRSEKLLPLARLCTR